MSKGKKLFKFRDLKEVGVRNAVTILFAILLPHRVKCAVLGEVAVDYEEYARAGNATDIDSFGTVARWYLVGTKW